MSDLNKQFALFRDVLLKIMTIVFVFVGYFGCNTTEQSTCSDSSSLYQQADFPIGVAINVDEFNNNPVYKSIAEKQFNSFTAENIFKADNLHPAEGFFNWTEADALADFCVANNKRIHGHTLIWHSQLLQWIIDFQGSEQDWENLFKEHIQTIVKHFKGRVKAWDVVNEAFNEDGTLRNSIWRQKLGNQYIEKAFRYAHEADPEAILFYSDYNLESNPSKRKSALNYLNNLRRRGVKVDGIGLQMHVGISFPEPAQLAESFKCVTDNHYKLHLSELDISVNLLGKDIEADISLFQKQADYLGKIVLNYKQIPTKYQYGITFWGVSDRDSWIPSYYNREDYPLLYDQNYVPKPAYCKLLETL